MTRRSLRSVLHLAAAVLGGLMVVAAARPGAAVAQAPPPPLYVALGDSIEFGLGDNIPADGIGYTPLFQAFLSTTVFQRPVDRLNLGVPFATARDIWRDQLPAALAAIQGRAPVVVTWGGGGNDLAEVVTGPQAAACRQSQSCLGRLNALLNEVEQTIDHTIAELREAIGPNGHLLMRTQYNALMRTGCQTPANVLLGTITLEGAPGTVLDRGLNTRIREVAQKYDAQVIDLFLPFAVSPDTLVAADCIHPSGLGHQLIAFLASQAFQ
jgi:lysophospholipase L1-like esterase